MKYTIRALYLNFITEKLIAYVGIRLVTYFNSKDVYASMMGVTSSKSMDKLKTITIQDHDTKDGYYDRRVIYFDAFPRLMQPFMYRFLSTEIINKITEWRFLKTLKTGDIAYLYPGCSIELINKLKRKGCIVVTERINTLRYNSKIILDAEYKKLNLEKDYTITEMSANEEISKMHMVDYIFSPCPAVTQSIIKAGINEDKIINTSYGMDSNDILAAPCRTDDGRPIKVLFAGAIGLRKGVHFLLSAWQKANCNGELILVGNISSSFHEIFDKYRTDPSIRHVPFVDDLKPLFSEADIFILPSIEEGSPLVTYLALGASLPMIVSFWGAGGVVNHGKEGLVIDPRNENELVGALQTMIGDAHMRKRMANASRKAADYYTWDKVAVRRRDLLFDRIQKDKFKNSNPNHKS